MTMRLWYLALGSLLSLALAGVLGTSLALLLVLARRGVAC